MNFGEAIEALKKGQSASRSGWNGKNMFIYLNRGGIDNRSITDTVSGERLSDENLGTIDGVSLSLFEGMGEGIVTRLPNINMQAASGNCVTGWLASQTDMLAEDWQILQE